MSCSNCRDSNVTRLAFSVILICWAVWMLIDDVEKLKKTVTRMQDSLSLAHEKLYEREMDVKEEVKSDG